ncbi:hypothetical protein BVRB_7g157110 [Beta vulgaris subsp. vulgaris]|nr:hypothetical protein BVRB_7g157110 [Beta vulgaris subsp. vulgaris]
MRLLSSVQDITYGVNGGMLVFMSISVISMLVFACVDDGKPKKHRTGGGHGRGRTHTSGGFFAGGFSSGGGCGGGGGGGGGGCGGGGGGGGGGC